MRNCLGRLADLVLVFLMAILSAPLASFLALGDVPLVDWERIYSEDTGWCVRETQDGGLFLVCSAESLRLDSLGNVIWDVPVGGLEGQQTTDGGYVVFGGYASVSLEITKLSSVGSVEWERSFQEQGSGRGYGGIQTIDGGFVIIGTGGAAHGTSGVIIKTDSSGNEEWRHVWEVYYASVTPKRVIQSDDGGYVVVGKSCVPSPCYSFITKLDASGNVTWHGHLDRGGGESILQEDAGGYLVVGSHESASDALYVARVGGTGTKETTATFCEAERCYGFGIVRSADGRGYVVAGRAYSEATRHDATVMLIDYSLSKVWELSIDRGGVEGANWIERTSDGGYVLAGYRYIEAGGHLDRHSWVVKLSDDAEPENVLPVADTGPDQTATDIDGDGSELITLDGSGSYDPDGIIVSWLWEEDSREIATGEVAVVDLPVGTHEISLTVVDDEGDSDSDAATVAVLPPADGVVEKWAFVLCGDPEAKFVASCADFAAAIETWWLVDVVDTHFSWQGTEEELKDAMRFFFGALPDADDQVIFYFAGHGHTGLVEVQYSDGPSTIQFDTQLSQWLISDAAATVVILDSCASGSAIEGASNLTGSGRLILTASDVAPDEAMGFQLPGLNWFALQRFTRHLVDAIGWNVPSQMSEIAGGDGLVSVRDAFDYADEECNRALLYPQDPQIWPEGDENDLIFRPQRVWSDDIGAFWCGAFCPVNIIVRDPLGRELSQAVNEVGSSAFCVVGDFDGDGSSDTLCKFHVPIPGEYSIEVVAEPGADPTQSYTLFYEFRGVVHVLADDVRLQDIPPAPYQISLGEQWMRGDANGDGVIDLLDARICLQIAEGAISASSVELAAADVDADGDVDADDAAILAEYVIGIRETLP